MKKTTFLIIFSWLLVMILIVGCSIVEPSNQGSSSDNPIYVYSFNGTYPTHNTTHQNGGVDEINVVGLSGLLADDQHIIDAEAVSAIENAGSIDLPETTLTGDMNVGGKSMLSTSETGKMYINDGGVQLTRVTDASNGYNFAVLTQSNSPADFDELALWYMYGYNDNAELMYYHRIEYEIYDASDGTEDARILWYMMDNGSINCAMTLLGDGSLAVDVGYGTFDDYDDAELLEKSIKDGEIELLEEAGILIRKPNKDGNWNGEYLMDIAKMARLLAGGIYQNRDYVEYLENELDTLKADMAILKGGVK